MCLDATTLPEEWRSVGGFEGFYEVSNLGRVRRIKAGMGSRPGRLVKGRLMLNGYLQVCLKRRPRRSFCYVHRLVALAFIGPPPAGLKVNHLDGIKSHNCAVNLEWATTTENAVHALRLGLVKRQRMTLELIEQIRALKGTETQADIARRFGFSPTTIWRVMTDRTCLTG